MSQRKNESALKAEGLLKGEELQHAATTLTYEDEFVRIDERGITIYWYYFPAGSKCIPWHHVRQYEAFDTAKQGGIPAIDYKAWGKFVTVLL